MIKLLAGVIIAVAVVIIAVAIGGIGSYIFAKSDSIVSDIHTQQQTREVSLAEQIHDQVNKERTVIGLKPLAWNQDAANNAQTWAKHLNDSNTFEHSTIFCRGENLVDMKGSFTAEEAVNAWMNSHEHRDNIRNSAFTSEGIGVSGAIVVENFC